MEGESVIKCTGETAGKPVAVEVKESRPIPIEQFLTGKPLEGCGMSEAKALTHMMVMAYKDA
jgi:hypothetical protein